MKRLNNVEYTDATYDTHVMPLVLKHVSAKQTYTYFGKTKRFWRQVNQLSVSVKILVFFLSSSSYTSSRHICCSRYDRFKNANYKPTSVHDPPSILIFPLPLINQGGRDRSVDIALATGWTVRGSNPGGWWDFLQPSRPALGPTQPPVQRVPRLSRG